MSTRTSKNRRVFKCERDWSINRQGSSGVRICQGLGLTGVKADLGPGVATVSGLATSGDGLVVNVDQSLEKQTSSNSWDRIPMMNPTMKNFLWCFASFSASSTCSICSLVNLVLQLHHMWISLYKSMYCYNVIDHTDAVARWHLTLVCTGPYSAKNTHGEL